MGVAAQFFSGVDRGALLIPARSPQAIEFAQQNNPGPSCFHDLHPEGAGRSGAHHLAS